MNEEKREKFTTTLYPSIVIKLEEIKLSINKNNNGRKIRGLNEVIEIITNEKWGELNDSNKK